MGNKHHPKDSKPGYRVQRDATNGPYTWGKGPQPYGFIGRIITKLMGK